MAALDDVDDLYSDPGVDYGDYVSQPRAHAVALAFASQPRTASPQVHHFDDEELDEMDQDPDADHESSAEEEVQTLQHLDDDHDNDHNDSAHPEAGYVDNQQIIRVPHQLQRITDVADDSQASLDGDEDMPEAQHRAVPPGKKVGVRDYEPHAQEVLVRAITIYKTHIAAENAYPDKLQEKTWAKAAWNRAMRELDIKIKADSRAIELVSDCCSTVRI